MRAKTVLTVVATMAVMVVASVALAANANTTSANVGADLQTLVTDLIHGPVGFVAGVGAICLGAVAAIRAQIMMAFPAILGGAALLKADSIANSLGAKF